jgi:RNA polymerase-binding transcription factor DksA
LNCSTDPAQRHRHRQAPSARTAPIRRIERLRKEEYTLELRTRDPERKLLKKKVDKVIRMVDDGESWLVLKKPASRLASARLIARPTATLSIEAQERRGKAHAEALW